jgi:TP901 family phage tail tape measure protein
VADVATLSATLGLNPAPFLAGLAKAKGAAASASTTSAAALGILGVAAVGAGAAMVAIGTSFQSADNKIRVATGATGERLSGLEQSLRNVARQTPASLGTVADAIGGVNARLELTGRPLEGLSLQFVRLSRITGTDLNENIRQVTRSFGDWGVSTRQMPAALDQIFRASQMAGVPVSDLATNITNFGAPLRSLGFDMTEATAMFTRFEREGVNTSTVMSGMKMAVKNFASGMAQSETGVSSFDEALAGVRDGTFDVSDAMQVFGARAGTDVFKAMQEGRFELDRYVSRLENGKDTIAGASGDVSTLAGKFGMLKNRIMVNLEPIATFLLDRLTAGFQSIIDAFDNLSPEVKRFAAIALACAAAVAVLVLGAMGLSAVLAFLASPIIAIPAALALLAAGLIYAYQHFEGFRDVVDGVWQWMQGVADWFSASFAPAVVSGFQAVVDWAQANWPPLRDTIHAVITGIMGVFHGFVAAAQALWRTFGGTVVGYVTRAFEAARTVVQGLLNIIMGVVRTVMAVIRGDWGAAWEGIQQIVEGIWGVITGTIMAAVNFIRTNLEVIWRLIAGAADAVWTAILATLSGIWNTIVNVAGTAWHAMRAVVLGVWQGIASAASAIWGGITSFFSSVWNGIIGFATGAWNRFVAILRGAWTRVVGLIRGSLAAVRGIVVGGFNAVVGFIAGIPGRVMANLSALVNVLRTLARQGMTAFFNGIRTIWGMVAGWFGGLPGRVLSAVGDLGGSLVQIGRDIIDGLWQGMQDMWDNVTGWLGNLNPASWFNDINLAKGHAEKNLLPTGRAVMAGLGEGMAAGWGDVTKWMSTLNPNAALALGSTVAGSGASMSPYRGAASTATRGDKPPTAEAIGKAVANELERRVLMVTDT